jgi:hypothetical protein
MYNKFQSIIISLKIYSDHQKQINNNVKIKI